jgi:hypothetical protein
VKIAELKERRFPTAGAIWRSPFLVGGAVASAKRTFAETAAGVKAEKQPVESEMSA